MFIWPSRWRGWGGAALTSFDWVWGWAAFDLIYRVGMGIIAGIGTGWAMSRISYSRLGDASTGGWNAMVLILAATLVSYGLAEAVDGYGFLAVFLAARTGRAVSMARGDHTYERAVHHGADPLESILLVLLLLWFGMFIGAGALEGWRWSELGFAVALIFVLRPLVGWLSLRLYHCKDLEAWRVAFFGIRGMGSVFYIAYAQNHADFSDIDAIWRIAAITILLSIVVHGFAANVLLPKGEPERHPAHG
ncbi:MAG: cation:proton antiporter [Pseudomonadota bacterium]